MAFIYGGWSNSIRIEIPASLNSSSSSSTSSRSSNSSLSSTSSRSSNSSLSSGSTLALNFQFPLEHSKGPMVSSPGGF